MITYSSNDFRVGLKIILNNEPCVIESSEFVKPGKGQAFVRVRLHCLLTGTHLEKTFKSTDTIESADVVDVRLTYLYNDDEFWYFINNETFEQLAVHEKIIGENIRWISDQIECTVTLWNDQPISIIPPNFVEMKIIDTDPGLKGNTTSSSGKLAILSTGVTVKVPLFLQIGEIIKVDTRSGEYVSRVK